VCDGGETLVPGREVRGADVAGRPSKYRVAIRPPAAGARANTVTPAPASASTRAHATPEMPPPTMKIVTAPA
jgi:hypothetical protein